MLEGGARFDVVACLGGEVGALCDSASFVGVDESSKMVVCVPCCGFWVGRIVTLSSRLL